MQGAIAGAFAPDRLSKKPGELERAAALSNFQSCPAACTAGTGRFLRRKIPFSREKSVSLQAPRPKNLRFLAETGEGGSGGGACSPVHQLVKTFFDKLAGAFAPERLQGNYGSVQMSRRSKRPNARCFLALPKRKGGWSSHPQLCMPFISFYTCDLPPIFSFSHSTVSRIVLLSGLGV